MKERIRARYKRLKARQEEENPTKNEKVVLMAKGIKYKRRCFLCGEIGHKQFDCSDNSKKIKQELIRSLTKKQTMQRKKGSATSVRKKVIHNPTVTIKRGKTVSKTKTTKVKKKMKFQ
jgi:Zinc knuckle